MKWGFWHQFVIPILLDTRFNAKKYRKFKGSLHWWRILITLYCDGICCWWRFIKYDSGSLEKEFISSWRVNLASTLLNDEGVCLKFSIYSLKKLHDLKIVHRDLKCANIFISNGVFKLGDLNVSKVAKRGLVYT